MSRHSVSPLEQLLGLIGTALVTLGAFIWRVYTAKPEYEDQPTQGSDQP
ncbi:hypothetical protein ACDX36_26165 [Pseudomonas aeruginosa]|jgi:hypothetical protein